MAGPIARWSSIVWLGRTLCALLVLLPGCGTVGEYDGARAAWEARDAQAPASCPATRRSNGTCIRDGP